MQPDLAISVRRASLSDAPALAALVNRAYAVEVSFVDGDRTDASEIAELIENGTFIVLEHKGGLTAAVYVEPKAGYIGMLSVDPTAQKHGLGTRLVRIAEALCEAGGCMQVNLQIINLREELARWYRSLGYREVGTAPYEHRPVKQPCHFVLMAKSLRPVTQTGASLGAVAA
ncbi:MAG: GNAT family N-acetyltransferase [Kofleriaceae bacterium]|nr:GNAT family N-acetyltransferase [Kofleriaceae bacterium]